MILKKYLYLSVYLWVQLSNLEFFLSGTSSCCLVMRSFIIKSTITNTTSTWTVRYVWTSFLFSEIGEIIRQVDVVLKCGFSSRCEYPPISRPRFEYEIEVELNKNVWRSFLMHFIKNAIEVSRPQYRCYLSIKFQEKFFLTNQGFPVHFELKQNAWTLFLIDLHTAMKAFLYVLFTMK